MKKPFLCSISAAIICWAATNTIVGQSTASSSGPVPTEPLLSRARDGSWTISYKYKDNQSNNGKVVAAPADRIATIKVEKKGKVYHVITTKVSGGVTENWCVEDMQIAKPEGAKSFVRLTAENPLYVDFSKTDFDELSWIGMDDFKGLKEVSTELKVFIFEVKNSTRRLTAQEAAASGNVAFMEEQQVSGKDPGGKKGMEQIRSAQFGDTVSKATLDVVSQLPVEYDNGYFDRTYSFSSTIPSNVPIDIIQLLQTMREQKRRTFVRASPP